MPEDNITKTGQLNYRELQEINNRVSKKNDLDDLLKITGAMRSVSPTKMNQFNEYNNASITGAEANELGIGESRFDKRITDLSQLENLNEFRAQQQSAGAQITSGFGKAAVLTGTTFLDTFAGTIAGILNFGKELASGNIDSGRDALNAFVNNPVSEALQQINDWSEKAMPNYYTEQERENSWTDNLFSANFIGDHFIKNIGFFAGAYLSGRATAGLLTKAMGINDSKKIFEGAVKAASGKELKGKEAIDAVLKGTVPLTDETLADGLKIAANSLKNEQMAVKAISSIAGSMGESRIEAISGSKDGFDRKKQLLDANLAEYIDHGVDDEIQQEHPDWYSIQAVRDSEGRIAGYKRQDANIAVEEERNRKIQQKQQQYNAALEEITNERAAYANTTFLMNMAVLASDYGFQFGDAFVSGFRQARIANGLVKAIDGKYKKMAGAQIAKEIGSAILSPIAEGTQEMFQEAIQKTSAKYYGNKLNQFYGEIIDQEAQDAAATYLQTFVNALGDVYSDKEEWENFALGAVTAMLGVPSMVNVRDDNGNLVKDDKGRAKKKLQWSGEFWDSIRNVGEIRKQASLDEKALNDLIENDNYRTAYYNLVRQIVNNDKKQKALISGDEKAYRDAEYDSIVSRALTYIETGRYQDLLDEIDKIYTIDKKDIPEIKALTTNKETGESIFDGKTDKEILDAFAKQKEQLLKKVERIKEVSENINRIYGNKFNIEQYNTIVSLATTINDREERIKQVSQEVLDYLNNNIVAANNVGRKKIETIKSINELAIALSPIEKAKSKIEILEAQRKALKDRPTVAKKLEKEIEKQKRALDNIRKKERDEKGRYLAGGRAAAEKDYITLKEAREAISEIQDIIENGDKPLGLPKQLGDLGDLLVEREALIIGLNEFSDNPLAIDSTLYNDIKKSIESRNEKIVRTRYEKVRMAEGVGNKVNAIKSAIQSPDDIVSFKQIATNEDDKDALDAIEEIEKIIDSVTEYNKIFSKYKDDADFGEAFNQIKEEFDNVLNMAESANEYNEATSWVLKKLRESKRFGDETDSIIDTFENEVKQLKKSKQSQEQGKKSEKEKKEENDEENKKPENRTPVSKQTKSIINSLLAAKDVDNAVSKLDKEDIAMAIDSAEFAEYCAVQDMEPEEFEEMDVDGLRDIVASGIKEMKAAGIKSYADIEEDDYKLSAEEQEGPAVQDFGDDDIVVGSNDINAEREPQKKSGTEKQPVVHLEEPKSEDKDGNADEKQQLKDEDVWAVNRKGAKYNIDALKDREKRSAIRDDSHWASEYLNGIPGEDTDFGARAQEFLDSGELAEMVEKYGDDLVFRFVSIRTDKNSAEQNNKENSVIFIAVEIPDGYTVKNGNPSNALMLGIGNNASTKKVQLIGQVSSASGDENLKGLVDKVIEERKTILDAHGLNKKNINNFVVVGSDYTTNLEYIFSGRLVKTNDKFNKVENRDLVDILDKDDDGKVKSVDGKIQLGIVTNSGTILIGKDLNGEIVPLNSFRGQSQVIADTVKDRVGTPWILVKEADGRIYSKAIGVKLFDSSYTDDNSYYANQIKKAIKLIIGAKTKSDMVSASHRLAQYLYIPDGNKFAINRDARTIRQGDDIVSLDSENAEQEIYEFLKRRGYKFTFGNTNDSIDQIVGSNIFTTDLAQIRNTNASILVSRMVANEDGTYSPVESERIAEMRATGAIHTGKVSFDSTRNYGPRIKFGGDDTIYRQRGTGKDATFWIEVNGSYEPVVDAETKFKIEFATQITNGQLNPVQSSKNKPLFIPRDGKKRVKVYEKKDNNGKVRYMTEDFYLLTDEDVVNLSKVLKKAKDSTKALDALKKNQEEFLGQEGGNEKEGGNEAAVKRIKGVKRKKTKSTNDGSGDTTESQFRSALEEFANKRSVAREFIEMRRRVQPDMNTAEFIAKISKYLAGSENQSRESNFNELMNINMDNADSISEYIKKLESIATCLVK